MYPSTGLSIYYYTGRLFTPVSIHSCTQPSICRYFHWSIHLFLYSCIILLFHSSIHTYIHKYIHLYIYWIVSPFIYLLTYVSIHPLYHSPIHLINRAFIHPATVALSNLCIHPLFIPIIYVSIHPLLYMYPSVYKSNQPSITFSILLLTHAYFKLPTHSPSIQSMNPSTHATI